MTLLAWSAVFLSIVMLQSMSALRLVCSGCVLVCSTCCCVASYSPGTAGLDCNVFCVRCPFGVPLCQAARECPRFCFVALLQSACMFVTSLLSALTLCLVCASQWLLCCVVCGLGARVALRLAAPYPLWSVACRPPTCRAVPLMVGCLSSSVLPRRASQGRLPVALRFAAPHASVVGCLSPPLVVFRLRVNLGSFALPARQVGAARLVTATAL